MNLKGKLLLLNETDIQDFNRKDIKSIKRSDLKKMSFDALITSDVAILNAGGHTIVLKNRHGHDGPVVSLVEKKSFRARFLDFWPFS